MPELDKDYIISKIQRAHRAKGNNYGTILPVIAKFSDWTFSEQAISSFIRASKDKKDETPTIISLMCSATLTKRRNNAMIKRKELRKDDHRIQAYVKYPAVLMVKYPGESVYTSYAEYQTDLSLTIQPIILPNAVYTTQIHLDGYVDCVGTIDTF